MKDICPCFGCKERTAEPNCHATCYEKYIPWQERQAVKAKRKREIVHSEARANEHIFGTIAYHQKRKKGGRG